MVQHTVAKDNQANVNACVTGGLLQVVEVRVFGQGAHRDTYALCDPFSTNSWIAKELQDELKLTGEKQILTMSNLLQGIQPVNTTRVTVEVGSLQDPRKKPCRIQAFTEEHFDLGDNQIDVAILKQKYKHLEPLEDKVIDFKKAKVLLGQDAFHLIRPLEYRCAGNNVPWAVRNKLGWVISGPLPEVLRKTSVNASLFHSWTALVGEPSEHVKSYKETKPCTLSNVQADARNGESKRAVSQIEIPKNAPKK